MGRSATEGRAIALALAASLVGVSAPAFAQDSTDLEFRLSGTDSYFERNPFPEETEPQELREADVTFRTGLFNLFSATRIAAVASPALLAAGVSDECNGSDRRGIPRTIHRGIALLGATPSSNAAERNESEEDTALSGRVSYAYIRQSRQGFCRLRPGQSTAFDPDWRLTSTFDARASDYLDDVGSDASSVALNFAFSHRIGDDITDKLKFRTRAGVALNNSVGYGEFYEDWSYTSHNLRFTLDHTFFANNSGSTAIALAGGRSFSNPDTSSYSYGGVEVTSKVSEVFEDWALAFTGAVNYRDYDNYEPTTREDTIYSLGAAFTHDVGNNVELSIGLNFTTRNSSDPTRDFDAVTLPITFTWLRDYPD